jgi:hypothetical protein
MKVWPSGVAVRGEASNLWDAKTRFEAMTCGSLSQHRRITLIRRFLTNEQIPLIDRVTAVLILLYAQPTSRIVQLTTSDITRTEDGEVLLHLGDPPTPVPEPFASLLPQHVAARPNMMTATSPGSHWLFPGRRAGQANPSDDDRRAPSQAWPAPGQRPNIRHPSARLPSPRLGRRGHARLPRRHNAPPRSRIWNPLEPLRPRQPNPVPPSSRRSGSWAESDLLDVRKNPRHVTGNPHVLESGQNPVLQPNQQLANVFTGLIQDMSVHGNDPDTLR